MPIATRADIEAIRGPVRVQQLLDVAVDPAADPVDQTAQAEARLSEALQAGDDLVAQFLDISELDATDPRWNVLRRFAVEEAFYWLQKNSDSGSDEWAENQAALRRSDLAHMRKREQWPGTSEKQPKTVSEIVESASPFSLSKLGGYI